MYTHIERGMLVRLDRIIQSLRELKVLDDRQRSWLVVHERCGYIDGYEKQSANARGAWRDQLTQGQHRRTKRIRVLQYPSQRLWQLRINQIAQCVDRSSGLHETVNRSQHELQRCRPSRELGDGVWDKWS